MRLPPAARLRASAELLANAGTSALFGAWMMLKGVGQDIEAAIRRPSVVPLGRSLVRLLQWPLDTLLMVLGRLLGAVQVSTGVEAEGRPLSPDERALAASIFAGSVQLDRIRIKERSLGIFGVPRRAFVLGNVIYVPRVLTPRTLVHELVHVWQFQRGGLRYLTCALWAQCFGEGYDYGRGLAHGKTFDELNPEQQAQWVEELFTSQVLLDQPAAPVLARLRSRRPWA